MNRNRMGFTLVEIMIVVSIIGIVATIAVPNFMRSRADSQKNSCIANMKQLYGASEQWKLSATSTATTPTVAQLIDPATGYIRARSEPVCPTTKAGYTITDSTVSCATTGHVLL